MVSYQISSNFQYSSNNTATEVGVRQYTESLRLVTAQNPMELWC